MATPSVERQPFGTAPDGQPAHLWTLRVGTQCIRLTEWGAAWIGWDLPNRSGALTDVLLGFNRVEDLVQARGGCFGAICGRYANRIGGARFTLDGQTHTLAANNGPNCNHGGRVGFDSRRWSAEVGTLRDAAYARMTYLSPEGEEGFPGELIVTATYTLDARGAVRLDLRAECETRTVANLTNHAYFNLGGAGSSLAEHSLRVHADHFLAADADTLPTGDILPVEGTPFDFREIHGVAERIDANHPMLRAARGYDLCYPLRGPANTLRPAAELSHPQSGRRVAIATTAPALVLYTGNWLGTSGAGATGSHGAPYGDRSGVALETQNYPDAPNRATFPSAVVDAQHPLMQTTVWESSLLA